MKKYYIIVLFALPTVGCVTRYTPEGKLVKVVNERVQSPYCQFMGEVAGSSGSGFTESHDLRKATAQMMNRAAAIGANTISISKKGGSLFRSNIHGLAYRCIDPRVAQAQKEAAERFKAEQKALEERLIKDPAFREYYYRQQMLEQERLRTQAMIKNVDSGARYREQQIVQQQQEAKRRAWQDFANSLNQQKTRKINTETKCRYNEFTREMTCETEAEER